VVLCAGALAALACSDSARLPAAPDGGECRGASIVDYFGGPARRLDLLFVIDDSASMGPLQEQMAKNLPDFMNVLKDPASGGLPDLHIGVASSDLGAGRSLVPGCMRQGGDFGVFHKDGRNPVGCATPNDPYIIDSINLDGSRATNFEKGADIADVLSCIAPLGQKGCPATSLFGATLAALEPPQGDFLRDDAFLVVVMLTNGDDCTVPADADLFTDGTPPSYRCAETGLACDQPFPQVAPETPATLTNCHSREDRRLLRVSDFVAGLRAVKSDPSKILVAAIAALPTTGDGETLGPGSHLAAVRDLTVSAATASGPAMPVLNPVPGCERYGGHAALRLFDAVSELGGLWENICQDDYATAMRAIAVAINERLAPVCVPAKLASDATGTQGCRVVDRTFDALGVSHTDAPLHACREDPAPPCWKVQDDLRCEAGYIRLIVDRGSLPSSPNTVALASCPACDVTACGRYAWCSL
jgi:hypothetical protein